MTLYYIDTASGLDSTEAALIRRTLSFDHAAGGDFADRAQCEKALQEFATRKLLNPDALTVDVIETENDQ